MNVYHWFRCCMSVWYIYCLLYLCMFMPMYIAYIKGGLYRNKEEEGAQLNTT